MLLYLLKLAKQREAQALKILSDFSLVIKFVHGKSQIQKLSLSALADHIEEIAHSFGRIGDRHIFTELKSDVGYFIKTIPGVSFGYLCSGNQG